QTSHAPRILHFFPTRRSSVLGSAEWRFARDISGKADPLRVEACGYGHRRSLGTVRSRLEPKELIDDPPAARVHNPGCRANVLIREAGDILPYEINETPLPLQRCEEHERRRMHPLSRHRGSRAFVL